MFNISKRIESNGISAEIRGDVNSNGSDMEMAQTWSPTRTPGHNSLENGPTDSGFHVPTDSRPEETGYRVRKILI